VTWPTEGEAVPASLHDQLQSPTPVRVPVPMVEQEARANRFVSLLEGHTENEPQPKHNKVPLLWQLAAVPQLAVWVVRLLLEESRRSMSSGRQGGRENRTQLG